MMRYFVYEIYKTKSYLIVDRCVGDFDEIKDAEDHIIKIQKLNYDLKITNREYVIMPRFQLSV